MIDELFSIVLPIFNEEQAIKDTVEQIQASLKNSGLNFEIIAVNDGSTDKSGEILQSLSGLKVINHKINTGYGSALKTGIKNARGEWIVITDVDGTYPIEDISRLAAETADFDMVVGARQGLVAKDPAARHLAKKLLNNFASFLAGQKITDINSGLRLFKKSIVLDYWNLFPDRFSFTSTLTMVCFTNGYQVKYLPINYYKRVGQSSIRPKNFVEFVRLVTKLALYFRPFKVFAWISLFIFALSLLIGFYSALIIGKLADVITIVLVMTALQTFFFGVLAEIVIKTRK